MKVLILVFSLMLISHSIAKANVAKAIIVRGKVKAKIDGKIVDVKKGQQIKEGSVVQTAKRSFVKLLFIDKSQMNLGPNSKMVVSQFPKKKAGVITLLKGQLRSKVTKDYMNMTDKEKSKLFIKTKTAAMGVRGTDFQVNYNPKSRNTGLITFEGAVAMAKIDLKRGFRATQNDLERFVSGPRAVTVTQGRFSAVNPSVSEKASTPIQINKGQLALLEKNESGLKSQTQTNHKTFRSTTPPGVDTTTFINDSASIDQQFGKLAGGRAIASVKQEVTIDPTQRGSALEGGFVAVDKIVYIAPPEDSAIDPNTGLAVVSANMGAIDESGNWNHSQFTITDDGKLKAKPNRGPANNDPNGPTGAPIPYLNPDPEGGDLDNPNGNPDGTGGGGPPPPPPPPPPPSGPPPEFEQGGPANVKIDINAQ